MKKIAILGAGAWGSAMARVVGTNNPDISVVIYSNEKDSIDEINRNHTNKKYIKGRLNRNIVATGDLTEVMKKSDCTFIILPSKVVKDILGKINMLDVSFEKKFVIFTKGIDEDTGKFFSYMVSETFPKAKVAVLAGPNFAEEVAQKKATISTLATKDFNFFNEIEPIVNCEYFKIRYFDSPEAVQVGGLVKNVLAILCGISEGLKLGRNTSAALMLKGIWEVRELCKEYNYNSNVVWNPAGIGDMILTCSSKKSRNMSFGFRIGRGEKVHNIVKNLVSTVEGLNNAKSLSVMAEKVGVNSIAKSVLQIVEHDYGKKELKKIITNEIFS
jgi:glycerol-3-phosphate dehydrogenase (NAD(P)+)